MENLFKEFEKKMSAFESSVESDISTIQKYKDEMRQMRDQMAELVKSGRYIRDDERIILSAPEIIIGNVDCFGVLKDRATSKIIIRGKDVGVEASGLEGSIALRATTIRETAEDPGDDGCFHGVWQSSTISNQARKVIIQSNDEPGDFYEPLLSLEKSGVIIESDNNLRISALKYGESKEKRLNHHIKELNNRKDRKEIDIKNEKRVLKDLVRKMELLMDEKEKLLKDENDVRVNYQRLEWLNADLEDVTQKSINYAIRKYEKDLSELTELNGLIKYLKQRKDKIVKGDDFLNNSTDTSITIASEKISITSCDGDNNVRENPGAGIDMTANLVTLNAKEADNSLKENGTVSIMAKNIEMVGGLDDAEYDNQGNLISGTHNADGKVRIQSKNILLESVDYEIDDTKYIEKQLNPEGQICLRSKSIVVSTENAANMEKDENGNISYANYTAEGDISIRTKTLSVTSTDYDMEDGKRKEQSLTKDSRLFIRTEKTDLSATETDGSATGHVCVNAKDVIMKSIDVDKDSRVDGDLAENGSMLVYAEKVILSAEDAVSAMGTNISLYAKETFEAHQGDNNSVLQLSGGNVAVGANMTQVYGDTEVRGELKTPKATIDNLEVKASLKSPNISDGMAAPVPSAGKLDTKLEKKEYEDILEEKCDQQTEYESSCLNPANWDF